jgi:hypothetical protein
MSKKGARPSVGAPPTPTEGPAGNERERDTEMEIWGNFNRQKLKIFQLTMTFSCSIFAAPALRVFGAASI